MTNQKKFLLSAFAALALLLIGTNVLLNYLVDAADREFRKDLSHHVKIAALSLSADLVSAQRASDSRPDAACEKVWRYLDKVGQLVPELR